MSVESRIRRQFSCRLSSLIVVLAAALATFGCSPLPLDRSSGTDAARPPRTSPTELPPRRASERKEDFFFNPKADEIERSLGY